MNDEAARLVRELDLAPHPEGGYFRETYRSPAAPGERAALSSILFLLPAGAVSAMHRIDADEAWHHYAGDDVAVHVLADGRYDRRVLARRGPWQTIVDRAQWFGAEVLPGADGFALVGCDVAPAFSFDGFALADRATLVAEFPHHAELVRLV